MVRGWAYDRLAAELCAAGHRVLVAALAGLGARKEELSPAIDLATHVGDVVTRIETSGFDRFVLVGYSYGGVIITGVAAMRGARIEAMIYVDAYVPGDGQPVWDLSEDWARRFYMPNAKPQDYWPRHSWRIACLLPLIRC
jgi:pimeloyl-ACP methyl ester carboxylesterase